MRRMEKSAGGDSGGDLEKTLNKFDSTREPPTESACNEAGDGIGSMPDAGTDKSFDGFFIEHWQGSGFESQQACLPAAIAEGVEAMERLIMFAHSNLAEA